MIYGIGTDVVTVTRMAAAFDKFGERFAQRILAPEEWDAFAACTQPGHFLAKRFAAKEAFAKAMGTGLRHPVTLHGMYVVHDALGRPAMACHPEMAAALQQRGIQAHHLSISDEKELAVAFVVLEC